MTSDRDPLLDPDMAAAIAKDAALVAADGGAPGSLAENRAQQSRLATFWNEGAPALREVAPLTVEGGGATALRAILYRPVQHPTPIVLFLHGGGWVRGSPEVSASASHALAAGSGLTVVALAYRLAPEHPYPAALDDVDSAIDWCFTHAASLGLDSRCVLLAGASAGANLAVAAALRRRDRGRALPRGLALFYGVFQLTDFANGSYRAFGDGRYLLSEARMRNYRAAYLPGGVPHRDPYVEPLTASLAGLPPTWLGVAELDILRDEQLEMADRLAAAGVATTLQRYEGLTHGFGTRIRMVPRAAAAVAEAASFLRAAAQQQPD
jgi:acetyl esterase